jgi:hypothetical protein
MKNPHIKKSVNVEYIRRYVHLTLTGQFQMFGSLPPRLVCFNQENVTSMISQHLPDAAAREQFVSDFQLLCIAEGALAAACMVEVWMSPPDAQGLRPSEHTDRREFVIVNIELPDGKGEVNLYPIIREGDAKPRLGQFQTFLRQSVQGILSGFLPEKTPTESHRIIAATLLQRTGRVLHQFPLPNI